jgi:hypothetical protein
MMPGSPVVGTVIIAGLPTGTSLADPTNVPEVPVAPLADEPEDAGTVVVLIPVVES